MLCFESDVLLYKIMSIQFIFLYGAVSIENVLFQFVGLQPGDDEEAGDPIQTRKLFTADVLTGHSHEVAALPNNGTENLVSDLFRFLLMRCNNRLFLPLG